MGKYLVFTGSFFLLLISCNVKDGNITAPEGYNLVWSDEFDYTGKPDSGKWIYEYGLIRNNEAQYYTDNIQNARTENGTLIIEARKEKVKNEAFVSETEDNWKRNREFAEYTSSSISTRGIAEWKYGMLEIKAKIPQGVGMWPAIWMLGQNHSVAGWPDCGEIDIMEHVGYNSDTIYGTIHTGAFNHIQGTQKGGSIIIDDPYDTFHLYSVKWTPEIIEFFMDGQQYFSFANLNLSEAEWPFDQPFYLKLNVAVGGSWGGAKGIDDSVFPQQMVIDYVRVFQVD